jgi:hypothetical protein
VSKDKPVMTWGWVQGRCYVYLDDKPVADGATFADALKMLGDQLRKAEQINRAALTSES